MTIKKTLTLEFPAETDSESAMRRVLNADVAYAAIWDIAQEIFRPARKHGYPDTTTQHELDRAGEAGAELVHLLEKRFYKILEDHRINLEDWR